MKLEDMRASISEMSEEELLAHIRTCRASRRQSKVPEKKAAAEKKQEAKATTKAITSLSNKDAERLLAALLSGIGGSK